MKKTILFLAGIFFSINAFAQEGGFGEIELSQPEPALPEPEVSPEPELSSSEDFDAVSGADDFAVEEEPKVKKELRRCEKPRLTKQ